MKNKLKKALSFVLVTIILCSAIPFGGLTVFAAEETYSGTCGENLTWTFDEFTGELSITGTGEMYDYNYNNRPWESYEDEIKSVIIGNSVTTIGEYAFRDCNSLTSVTIPDSVTTIGNNAFSCCDILTSVTIPDSVITIGYSAFFDCDSLISVTIPDSVTTIGYSMFHDCDSLTSVTIPDSVTTIGANAFSWCDSLTSVIIPDSVTTIGDEAFAYCYSLTSVTIGNSVTTIGNDAFFYCYSLTSILVDGNNQYYSSDNYGVLYNKDKTELIQYPIGNERISFTIPDSVTTIGANAFSWCDSLTSVTIPDSVITIGGYAFYCCYSLTSVTIGDSVTTIGDYVFSFCDSLTSVTIGNSVTTIGYCAFLRCDSLTSITVDADNQYFSSDAYGVLYNKNKTELIQYPIGNGRTSFTIPDSVTTIGEYAFSYCDSLTSVTIPDSVTTIGDYAFSGCDSLSDVYFNGTEEDWNQISIGEYNEPLLNATIHFSVPEENPSGTCGDNLTWTFYESTGELSITGMGEMYDYNNNRPWESYEDEIKSVIIGNSVTTIGEGAFYSYDSLTSVTIGNSVTTIGSYAFCECTKLTSVTIPDSVTTISDYAFESCVSLTSVEIPDSVTAIRDYAFGCCTSLTIATIPDSVATLGKGAFLGSCFTSITIPNSITTIGESTFSFCCNLTSVIIPDSVTTIGESAFTYCDGLTSITISDSVTSIKDSAFLYCNNLADVYFIGTEEEWNKISIGGGNDALLNATIHFLGEIAAPVFEVYQVDQSGNYLTVNIDLTENTFNSLDLAFEMKGLKCTKIEQGEAVKESGTTLEQNPYASAPYNNIAIASTKSLVTGTIAVVTLEIIDSDYSFIAKSTSCGLTVDDYKTIEVKPIIKGVVEGSKPDVSITGAPVFEVYQVEQIGNYLTVNIDLTENTFNSLDLAFEMEGIKCTKIEPGDSLLQLSPYEYAYNPDATEPHSNLAVATTDGVSLGTLITVTLEIINTDYSFTAKSPSCCVTDDNFNNIEVKPIIKGVVEGSLSSHTYTHIVVPSTCKVQGMEYDLCTECGDVINSKVLPLADHSIVHYSKPSTCKEQGYEYDECSACGETFNYRDLPLADHSYKHIVVPSTCKVQGMEYDLCTECGETANSKTLPLAPHTWGEWEITKEPTVEAEGEETRTCSVCGDVESREIPKLEVIKDEETGVEIVYGDEYESGVEIQVSSVFDGNSYQIIESVYDDVNAKIFDISTTKDGEKVQPDGKVKVRIPVPADFKGDKIFVCYVDSVNGTVENIPATIKNGYIEFEAEHFSYYAVMEKLGKVNSVDIGNISMNYKDLTTIRPEINVDEGVEYTVTYSSSNPSVATVDENGNVYASGKGDATITCTVTDEYGNVVTDICDVEVKYSFGQWLIIILLFGWIWY